MITFPFQIKRHETHLFVIKDHHNIDLKQITRFLFKIILITKKIQLNYSREFYKHYKKYN